MRKCFNIMITGGVQDIGFRALIEDIARTYEISGFSFNDTDGSVKMVCCGENGVVADFLEEIKAKGAKRGAMISDILSEEIPFRIYLPQKFLRLYTDEFADIGRKLDKGNVLLEKILTHTSELPEIRSVMNSFVSEQREHNQWMKEHLIKMDEHNQRLAKILEKLASK